MIYLPVPNLLEPDIIAEFHLVVRREGDTARASLVDQKMDRYDDQVMLVFAAALHAFVEWAHLAGCAPAALIGDGGPEVARLRQEVYTLRAQVAATPGDSPHPPPP